MATELEVDELGTVTLFGATDTCTPNDQAHVTRFDDGLVHLCTFDTNGGSACVVIRGTDLIKAAQLVMREDSCGYCDNRGYFFNDKSSQPEWPTERPDFDNGGFSLCVCHRADDVDLTVMPTRR